MEITRTAEPRLEQLANSAILKVLANAVLILAPPLIGWGMNTILDRLNTIDAALTTGRINNATTELRMLTLEKQLSSDESARSKASERLLKLEIEVEQLRRKQ